MEIHKVTKTIETEVYVTYDGKRFDDYEEAVYHERVLDFRKKFGNNTDKLLEHDNDDVYMIAETERDVYYISDFIQHVLNMSCYIAFDCIIQSYPCVVYYDDECNLLVLDDKKYNKNKIACNMYEKTIAMKSEDEIDNEN